MKRSVHLILYDGVCGLCNNFVQFVIFRDHESKFCFASLQSSLAQEMLAHYGKKANNLDTVYVIVNYSNDFKRLLAKSQAILFILPEFGGMWKCAEIFRILPILLLDTAYDFVARYRYRWFGRYDACLVPNPDTKLRFIDNR